ncbi:MAG: hypothetical protein KA712_14130 [Myxococcales bacterium]|nr:hypothetical protein [Myxococcales bacterium]
MDDGDSEPDFSETFLRELGQLVVQANYLEEALIDLLWITARLDEVTLLRTVRGKTLGALVQLVKDQATALRSLGLQNEFDKVNAALDDALDVRNQFVHASWVFEGNGRVERRTIPKRGDVREELRSMDVTDVVRSHVNP